MMKGTGYESRTSSILDIRSISVYLDRFAIRSAGYLDYHDDLSDETQVPEWIPNGSSEGYGIGIRPDDQEAIKAALISMSDIDVVDLMDDNARCKIQI